MGKNEWKWVIVFLVSLTVGIITSSFGNGFLTCIITIAVLFGIPALIQPLIRFFSKAKNTISYKTNSFTCPYCHEIHFAENCGLKCSKKIGEECHDFVTRDKDGWIPQYDIINCLNCRKEMKYLYCLNTNKEIPIDLIKMSSLQIALLGAKASGKSNYIGVLINEIQNKMSDSFNCSLSITSNREMEKAYKDLYYRPLYIEKRTVMATPGGETPPPLIFPLSFFNRQKNIALTFYDTAGENLDNNEAINEFNRYILNSHGIIMLLDPLQVNEIREKLKKNGFTDLPEQNSETSAVLCRIIDVMRNIKNIKGQIDIPLALVFTKIDVLEKYDVLKADSCLRKESEHIKKGAFLKRDHSTIYVEIDDLIGKYLGGALLGYIKQFKKHSFFGVTALGENPTDNGTKINGEPRPRRVLDPLLWLLAEYGYIKIIKG